MITGFSSYPIREEEAWRYVSTAGAVCEDTLHRRSGKVTTLMANPDVHDDGDGARWKLEPRSVAKSAFSHLVKWFDKGVKILVMNSFSSCVRY